MTGLIKQWIPGSVKRWAIQHVLWEEMPLPEAPKAFVFLAADYGNVGDLAITLSQARFLRRYSGKPYVVEVPISRTRLLLRSIKKQIGPTDLVTIIGGGNMGSLYPDIEELRQLVIRSFPRNRILCFPQTLDQDGSSASAKALEKIAEVYSRHDNLHVFARESVSLSKLRDLLGTFRGIRIGYAPDIVLSATAADLGATAITPRAGILLCMRGDRERAITEEQCAAVTAALARTGMEVVRTDTHVGGSRLCKDQCEELVRNKIVQFRSARLIVTDRLHGMILSVIAGTPCVVLPNSNHKILQTYRDWLNDNPLAQIVSLDQPSDVEEKLEKLLASVPSGVDAPVVDAHKYADLAATLLDR